jgi:hypothetical protein
MLIFLSFNTIINLNTDFFQKGHLLEQGWNKRIRELEIQAAHTRSLWKSKWERTKHQLTQRLHKLPHISPIRLKPDIRGKAAILSSARSGIIIPDSQLDGESVGMVLRHLL